MIRTDLYPLLFEPVLKDYIWGGRNLERLGRELPSEGVIAESWEIAGHEDGTTRVANGRFAGNFFGTYDSWAVNEHMTFHLKAEVQALFSNFSLEHFHEQDAPGRSASGPKHWHIFTVIAKKNE